MGIILSSLFVVGAITLIVLSATGYFNPQKTTTTPVNQPIGTTSTSPNVISTTTTTSPNVLGTTTTTSPNVIGTTSTSPNVIGTTTTSPNVVVATTTTSPILTPVNTTPIQVKYLPAELPYFCTNCATSSTQSQIYKIFTPGITGLLTKINLLGTFESTGSGKIPTYSISINNYTSGPQLSLSASTGGIDFYPNINISPTDSLYLTLNGQSINLMVTWLIFDIIPMYKLANIRMYNAPSSYCTSCPASGNANTYTYTVGIPGVSGHLTNILLETTSATSSPSQSMTVSINNYSSSIKTTLGVTATGFLPNTYINSTDRLYLTLSGANISLTNTTFLLQVYPDQPYTPPSGVLNITFSNSSQSKTLNVIDNPPTTSQDLSPSVSYIYTFSSTPFSCSSTNVPQPYDYNLTFIPTKAVLGTNTLNYKVELLSFGGYSNGTPVCGMNYNFYPPISSSGNIDSSLPGQLGLFIILS